MEAEEDAAAAAAAAAACERIQFEDDIPARPKISKHLYMFVGSLLFLSGCQGQFLTLLTFIVESE